MKRTLNIALVCLAVLLFGCESKGLFSGYRKEQFAVTKVTEGRTKVIQLINESASSVQHVMGMAFYANSNKAGHFQVSEVSVGSEKVGLTDIFVPPMSALNITIRYAPLDVETTEADFGGWVTTSEDRWNAVSEGGAVSAMSGMAGGDEEGGFAPAIHRTMLVVAYDKPDGGYMHVELVGAAVPGPNGEVTAVPMGGTGGTECVVEAGRACFHGNFSIDLPGLMSGGAVEIPMTGAVPFAMEGSAASLNMDEFPAILIVLRGNGPGEPLEGKPVDTISIIISGTPGSRASGSFDGRDLSLSDVDFRVRVMLAEITEEDITPSLAAAVDFNIVGLEIVTEEPFDGSKIIFGTETTLSENPSGNGLFDSFLGGARVVVKFSGMLELP